MDTYALAVQQLKKAIENAIEKAITNGELPQAEAASRGERRRPRACRSVHH